MNSMMLLDVSLGFISMVNIFTFLISISLVIFGIYRFIKIRKNTVKGNNITSAINIIRVNYTKGKITKEECDKKLKNL